MTGGRRGGSAERDRERDREEQGCRAGRRVDGSEERRRENASSSYGPNPQPPTWFCFVCSEWGDTHKWYH